MENISKQVISVEDKKVVGYILRPWIDFSILKKTGYIIVDEETEHEYFLRKENILEDGEVIVISSTNILEVVNFQDEFRKKVFSYTGDYYGIVEKYIFERNLLKKIITDRAEIYAKNIVNFGMNTLFLSFKRKRKKIFPRFQNEEIKVEVMEKKLDLPPIVNLSMSYYLGKVATKTLLGFNNELIVKEGVTITKQIFERAKKHNKINELYFVCR